MHTCTHTKKRKVFFSSLIHFAAVPVLNDEYYTLDNSIWFSLFLFHFCAVHTVVIRERVCTHSKAAELQAFEKKHDKE